MYEKQSGHPIKELLFAFGQGKLAVEEAQRIEKHLEVCSICCETLLGLQDDTFAGLVRAAHLASGATEATDAGGGSFHAPTLEMPSPGVSIEDTLPAELARHPRYRIIQPIGRGGMGTVYQAEHRLMHRPVAIKVINSELVRHRPALERFRREVQAAAKLSHPNIVAAYDAEQAGGLHLLVMEFVEGTDLSAVVAQHGPLSVAKACDCICQAANGLGYAADKGMVHRDIKPHNLMLTPDGRVRILDFGLAGFASERTSAAMSISSPEKTDHTQANLTVVGSVMGTPDYMAPEQAVDAHSTDIRADIYSLGCTLYFLLTGNPPFAGTNIPEKLNAHATKEPPDLTELRPDVPVELSRVAARMLAKTPAERFQSPADVSAALTHFLTAPSPRRRKRGHWLALLSTMAAVLVALAIVYVMTNRGTLVIETQDEHVTIAIGTQGVTIRDSATGRVFLVKPGDNRLRSGQYVIDVRELPEGVTLSTDRFTLTRGSIERVRAEMTQLPESADAPSVSDEMARVALVAQAFLEAIDQQEPDAAFRQMSALAHRAVTKEAFAAGASANTARYGRLARRTLVRSFAVVPVPGLPPGRYVAVQFQSDFEKQAAQWETVMLNVDDDGQWRVNAHAISAAPPALVPAAAGLVAPPVNPQGR